MTTNPRSAIEAIRAEVEEVRKEHGQGAYGALSRQLVSLAEDNLKLAEALLVIARWELPPTGHFSPDGIEYSYEHEYGSNGARDWMMNAAERVLSEVSNGKA